MTSTSTEKETIQNQIQNNFESKVSMKIETNSRGYNTTVHVYQGATEKEILDTVEKTIFAHNELQKRLRVGVGVGVGA